MPLAIFLNILLGSLPKQKFHISQYFVNFPITAKLFMLRTLEYSLSNCSPSGKPLIIFQYLAQCSHLLPTKFFPAAIGRDAYVNFLISNFLSISIIAFIVHYLHVSLHI